MRSNVEWRVWGERDPLYGVAAWDGREKDGPNPWTEAEFYAVGASDWADYHTHWESYGLVHDRCVEIGCGAGRLTVHLVDSFDEVIGVEISPAMIALAEKQLEGRARLVLADGFELPLTHASVSAAFSTFVFQHFDSATDADTYWRELARVLRPRGTLMIQLPVHSWPHHRRVFQTVHAVLRTAGDVRAWIRRLGLAHGHGKPFMRGLSYERDRLIQTISAFGFSDITLRTFQVRSNRSFHTFVFARRR
jgi:ubiquinone/menaquinone biosynthesis C-methylase UbiE